MANFWLQQVGFIVPGRQLKFIRRQRNFLIYAQSPSSKNVIGIKTRLKAISSKQFLMFSNLINREVEKKNAKHLFSQCIQDS